MPDAPKAIQIQTATAMISTLVHSGFYGELQIKFESGQIVHIREVQNRKIDDVAGTFKLWSQDNAAFAAGSENTPSE
jgi:hypothetical protein